MKVLVNDPTVSKYITPVRVKIIKKIIEAGEIQQRALAQELNMKESTLSYHVQVLENLGIIERNQRIIEKAGYFRQVKIIKYNPDNNIIELEVGDND